MKSSIQNQIKLKAMPDDSFNEFVLDPLSALLDSELIAIHETFGGVNTPWRPYSKCGRVLTGVTAVPCLARQAHAEQILPIDI